MEVKIYGEGIFVMLLYEYLLARGCISRGIYENEREMFF